MHTSSQLIFIPDARIMRNASHAAKTCSITGTCLYNNFPNPSTSLRQSRCNSLATLNQLTSCAPALLMRFHAEYRVISLNVPEASTTAKTSYPACSADNAGNVTHTSVTI